MTRHWGERAAAHAMEGRDGPDMGAVIHRISTRSFQGEPAAGESRQGRCAPFEGTLREGVAEMPPCQGLFALELE